MENSACFIGHRNTPNTDALRKSVRDTAERLIRDAGVVCFLFGSRSRFDTLCHSVITELQVQYPQIRRIAYTCRHECAVLQADDVHAYSGLLNRDLDIKVYDGEYAYPTKLTSGRANYIERNQAMIDDSDFCIFYFDEHYLPPRRKRGKNDLTEYQPKSGTAAAYAYAVQKKKQIVNLFG